MNESELRIESGLNGQEYMVRVRHEPTGKTVEFEEKLPKDSRRWIGLCLNVRSNAIKKLERLLDQ